MRIFFASFPQNFDCLPLIVLFDIKAAFPSVAHDWLFLVLEASGADFLFMNFVKALYDHVRVFVNVDGSLNYAFNAKSGVLTGCPLSASLFVLGNFSVVSICDTDSGKKVYAIQLFI